MAILMLLILLQCMVHHGIDVVEQLVEELFQQLLKMHHKF